MMSPELIQALLSHPYDRPLIIVTLSGERLEITGVRREGWEIILETAQPVQDEDTYNAMFNDAMAVVEAADQFKKDWVNQE